MDVLNLLKFWKTSTVHGEDTTINASKTQFQTEESQSENDVDDDEEEDSFFELEIRVPDCDNEKNRDTQEKDNKNGGNFNIAESNLSRFKGRRILPIEPNTKPQSPISILKSAPKFRVFMTSFNSSKTRKPEKTEQTEKKKKQNRVSSTETPKHSQQESKRFTVSLNVDDEEGDEEGEGIPVFSLFARANSSRTSKLQKQSSTDDSKRFSKDVVQKYLKLIKPFYVKVSKRYGENRVKLSDLLYTASPTSSPTPAPAISSPKNNPSGFRVLSKHLGKSRSASSAVSFVSSSPAAIRRDDSLLLQDDGIQSAILHCKRSFNSSRESYQLSRCTSDSSHEILTEPWRRSTEEESSTSDVVSM